MNVLLVITWLVRNSKHSKYGGERMNFMTAMDKYEIELCHEVDLLSVNPSSMYCSAHFWNEEFI